MLESKTMANVAQQVRDLEVTEYMGSMDGRYHPVLSQGPISDSRTGRWKNPPDNKDLEETYAECRNAQLNLTARVNKYLEKSKQPPLKLGGDGDWHGVKTQVERACVVLDKVLETKKKKLGFAGALRRGYDTLCRNAGVGKALSSVIPDDLMIASAVSGGLNIIFTALEEHGIYEESVFKALVALPEILNTNERYSDIAMNELEIHRGTARLYARVCEALDYILRWMMDNVFLSGAKQLFQPRRYSKDLNDKMAEVKLAAQALEQWASTVLLESQKDLVELQSRMNMQQAHTSDRVEDLHDKLDQLKSKRDRVTILQVFMPVTFNALQPVLNDQWSQVYLNRGNGRRSQARQTVPEVPLTSVEDVFEALLYDPDLVPSDVDNVLRQGTAPLHNSLQHRRVLAIQENPRVQAWLSLDKSTILLINGNAASHLDMSISFVSARIARALAQQASQPRDSLEVIPLAYFCGQHQSFSRDEAASPSELAMSLLLQLVDRHEGFSPGDLQRCLNETDPTDVGSILASFGRLMRRLPSRAIVYLLIDGIEHFSRPDLRRDQFQDVLIQLVDLFQVHKAAKLKLLFTCAQRSVLLERLDLLADDEIVEIPNSPPPGNLWSRESTALPM